MLWVGYGEHELAGGVWCVRGVSGRLCAANRNGDHWCWPRGRTAGGARISACDRHNIDQGVGCRVHRLGASA